MRHASTILVLSLALLTVACKQVVKSDADGKIFTEQEAIDKLTSTPRWCGQDLDNDGSYTVNMFIEGGAGQFMVYNSRTQNYTSSDPMEWKVEKERLTRKITGTHPAILTGRIRGDKNDDSSVKIIGDDGVVETLSTCLH